MSIKDVRLGEVAEVEVGMSYRVEADIFLGELFPEDAGVEASCGRLDPSNQFVDRFRQILNPTEPVGDRVPNYECDLRFAEAEHFGLNVRITPNHVHSASRHAIGLVIWGQGSLVYCAQP